MVIVCDEWAFWAWHLESAATVGSVLLFFSKDVVRLEGDLE
jgi:hypothetical protein